jgi:hypothetical protein
LGSLLIELLIVAAAAVGVGAFLYADGLSLCCANESIRHALAILFTPAILVWYGLGGVHGTASHAHFSMGLVIEFVLTWGIVSLVLWARSRRARDGTP